RVFQVESYSLEHHYHPGYSESVIAYGATDIANEHEYIITFQDEIYVICKADKVDEFLANNPSVGTAAVYEVPMTTPKPKDVDDELKRTKSDKIDELLAELSDVMTLIEMFGEHEDDIKKDRKYALMAKEIKAKLIELTEGGK